MSAAAQVSPKRISSEAFAQIPFLTDPILSPDGRKIAAKVTADGQESIAIWDLRGPRDAAPILLPANALGVQSIQWAGNSRLLVTIGGVLQILGVSLPMMRLLKYDLPSGKPTPIGRGRGFVERVIFVDPAGEYVLLSSQKDILSAPSVDKVNLADGSATLVQKSKRGVWTWFSDPTGFVRAGVEYGERRLKLYYRQSASDELRRIDTSRYPAPDAVIDMIRFLGDTQRGVIITNAQSGRFGVYEYDFATDAIGKIIFEHPSVDVTSIITGEAGVDGVLYEDDKPRMKWLNPEYLKIQQAIDRTLKGKTNLIAGQSDDRNILLIWSGGADDPGTYFVYDQAAKRMDAFAQPYHKLDAADLAAVEPVAYQARDGLAISGYLTLPRGRKAEALPLIVMPHGGPFARDSWTFNAQVQFLANRGYAVLQPNFRGSTGYGLDHVVRGHGQIGTGMIDDIEDGTRWLVNRGIVDPKRICIMGTSYGGYAAMWSAIRNPGLFRCAISMAGVTDWKAMLKYDRKFLLAPRYFKQWREQVEGKERSDLAAISPLQQASRLVVPLLLAHGELDTNVPVGQSKDLAKALAASRSPVEPVFYPKSAHGFSNTEDAADFMKRVETFLAKHNPS